MIDRSSTREEIFEVLLGAIEELFEIPRAEVTPQSSLYEELDLDSLDAADLRAHVHEVTGQVLPEVKFQDVRTVDDVVGLVHSILSGG